MLEIRQIPTGEPIDDFLNVVDHLYWDDPAYVRPLDMELRDRLNPRKNPFFQHGEATVFCAYRAGKCVGRVTAQIDRYPRRRAGQQAGHRAPDAPAESRGVQEDDRHGPAGAGRGRDLTGQPHPGWGCYRWQLLEPDAVHPHIQAGALTAC